MSKISLTEVQKNKVVEKVFTTIHDSFTAIHVQNKKT